MTGLPASCYTLLYFTLLMDWLIGKATEICKISTDRQEKKRQTDRQTDRQVEGDLLGRLKVAVYDLVGMQVAHASCDLFRPADKQSWRNVFTISEYLVELTVRAVLHHNAIAWWLHADAPVTHTHTKTCSTYCHFTRPRTYPPHHHHPCPHQHTHLVADSVTVPMPVTIPIPVTMKIESDVWWNKA